MEEENHDDDAEVINPYEVADPLNLPPPDSDTESEDMVLLLMIMSRRLRLILLVPSLGYHILCAHSWVPSMWVVDLLGRRRISHKRTKNKAKNDKTEHRMEKCEKTKPNRSQKVKKSKSRGSQNQKKYNLRDQ
ncbi:hypothetical protein Tco_0143240, partial [Tanacetum coccineum]